MIDPGLEFMGWDDDFASRADSGDLTIGVIGLGYVGLPTIIGFHSAGFNVWGVDISQRTVDTILRGENPTGCQDGRTPARQRPRLADPRERPARPPGGRRPNLGDRSPLRTTG